MGRFPRGRRAPGAETRKKAKSAAAELCYFHSGSSSGEQQRGAAAGSRRRRRRREITKRSSKSGDRGRNRSSSSRAAPEISCSASRSGSDQIARCGELLSKRASWREIAAKQQRHSDRMTRVFCMETGPEHAIFVERRLRRAGTKAPAVGMTARPLPLIRAKDSGI